MSPRTGIRLAGLGTAFAFGLLGCGNGTGPEGTGHVSVSLTQSSGSVIAAAGLGAPTLDVVPVGSIATMNVDVTAVEFHRLGADGEGGHERGRFFDQQPAMAKGELGIDVGTIPQKQLHQEGIPIFCCDENVG